ncbi:HIT domain-containing protein [Candidatus Nomurabacteria bacterium]|nr:HIT domain-containing protein [Candidatus Nomurabacteria bacterium]
MYNAAPSDYNCPICIAIQGIENEDTWIVQDDIFYRDDLVMGFISSKSVLGSEAHPLIVPLEHHENLYNLPQGVGHRIMDLSKKIAIALKEIRNVDGVTITQHNEPAGGQHAFHYHMHVFPRFEDDNFETELWKAKRSTPEERKFHAQALREYFE